MCVTLAGIGSGAGVVLVRHCSFTRSKLRQRFRAPFKYKGPLQIDSALARDPRQLLPISFIELRTEFMSYMNETQQSQGNLFHRGISSRRSMALFP
jgi:hypothetical protein